MQVPSVTQPPAKATWQVDTTPPAEAPQLVAKAGAGKAAVAKPTASSAPKVSIPTPTDFGRLPSDALESDEAVPTGPVRY